MYMKNGEMIKVLMDNIIFFKSRVKENIIAFPTNKN